MECPACDATLHERTVSDLLVDVCEEGCGGVWFDNFELEKVDEAHESTGTALLEPREAAGGGAASGADEAVDAATDHETLRPCPKCRDAIMHRHFFTVKREVEVDECPACAGVWLDAGELGEIRRIFETEEARDAAATKEYERLFGEQLDRMRRESRDDLEKTRAFSRALRFVLPSYWIPGDQEWGAF